MNTDLHDNHRTEDAVLPVPAADADIPFFTLPTFREIPNVGLYLEQITKYMGDYLAPLPDIVLTGSMISNYVKHRILTSPVRKQYNREQIACLFIIAFAKMVLTLEDIQQLLAMQRSSYTAEEAYTHFRSLLLSIEADLPDDPVCKLTRQVTETILCKIRLDAAFRHFPAQPAEEVSDKAKKAGHDPTKE